MHPHHTAGAQEAQASQPHPKGLYVLFLTEMWERFSYYGMRALLVLYMVNYFKWSQGRASDIYKWYTALVYLTPLVGGYLADRFLGNRRAVIIGGVLMAVGHFLMAFEAIGVFYAALGFLIVGNGMFKPNMSTQVGRLYADNDARRDSAYTIFYMGINLGAFFSPLVCGYLRDRYSFHYGFAAAGVGMLVGLATYVIGLPLVKEVSGGGQDATKTVLASDESETDRTPSALPFIGRWAPHLVTGLGAVTVPASLVLWYRGALGWDNLVIAVVGAGVFVACGWILAQVRGAARDRVLAIYVLAVFVVFFWAAFEQAGNAMNLWADQVTNRNLSGAPSVPAFPVTTAAHAAVLASWHFAAASFASFVAAGIGVVLLGWLLLRKKRTPALAYVGALALVLGALWLGLVMANPMWWSSIWNPVSTEWFQSLNPVFIMVLAPVFAWLWTFLARRGWNPSIATKMAAGVALMSVAFAVMILAARLEDKPSQAALTELPAALRVLPDHAVEYRDAPDYQGAVGDGQPVGGWLPAQGGRMRFEPGTLGIRGVLSATERDRILRASVAPSFVRAAMELAQKSEQAQGEHFVAAVVLDEVPAGFDLRYAGSLADHLAFDPATRTLSVRDVRLADKDYKALLPAAAPPAFRDALGTLFVDSARYRVSSWWLVWFYLLSTMGELCLSPVGLSMVSKLAPARFATMLMGIWLLTSFFGNFAAGALGESWGLVPPVHYFFKLVLVLGAAAVALFALVRWVVKMMHGVE